MTVKTEKQKLSFGDWLKEIRTGKGVGVRELANLVNGEFSASYISYLENNVYTGKDGTSTRPSEAIVAAIAKGLEVPLNEARLAAGYTTLQSEASEREVLNSFRSLVDGYPLLSETGKRIAQRQIDIVIRGLMEMDRVEFSKLTTDFQEIDSGSLLKEKTREGLASEEFTIDLTKPEKEPNASEIKEEFRFMTDEEIRQFEK